MLHAHKKGHAYYNDREIRTGRKIMDNLKIRQLNEVCFAAEEEGVRFFILKGTKLSLLADSGMHAENVRKTAEEIAGTEVMLINTHADRDHTGGNHEFERFMMHPSEMCNYEASGRKEGEMIPVFEGDCIDLGDRKIEVISIPGHTPGSIGLLDRKYRTLISGDPIQQNGRIYMFGPFRNMKAYIEGLKHLQKYEDAFDVIWPSHADLPLSKDVIPQLIQAAEDILSGKTAGKKEIVHGKEITAYDAGISVFLTD